MGETNILKETSFLKETGSDSVTVFTKDSEVELRCLTSQLASLLGPECLLSLLGTLAIITIPTAAGCSFYSTLEIWGWESASLAHIRLCTGALAL